MTRRRCRQQLRRLAALVLEQSAEPLPELRESQIVSAPISLNSASLGNCRTLNLGGYGWESRSRYAGRSFDEVEPELGRGWTQARGKSSLDWEKAKAATRDAWHRLERAIPGDADGDGR